jgi:hypothetical protein
MACGAQGEPAAPAPPHLRGLDAGLEVQLLRRAKHVVDEPVEGETAGHVEREPADHERQELQDGAGGGLGGVVVGRAGQALRDKLGHHLQQRRAQGVGWRRGACVCVVGVAAAGRVWRGGRGREQAVESLAAASREVLPACGLQGCGQVRGGALRLGAAGGCSTHQQQWQRQVGCGVVPADRRCAVLQREEPRQAIALRGGRGGGAEGGRGGGGGGGRASAHRPSLLLATAPVALRRAVRYQTCGGCRRSAGLANPSSQSSPQQPQQPGCRGERAARPRTARRAVMVVGPPSEGIQKKPLVSSPSSAALVSALRSSTPVGAGSRQSRQSRQACTRCAG